MKNTDWTTKLGQQRPSFYARIYFLLIPIFAAIFYFLPGVILKCTVNPCSFLEATYFSVVTITTLGYGDITPDGSMAQIFSALEALLGIITIGLFLNSLSFSISSAAQAVEARSQKRAQHLAELARLRSFSSIVAIYIARYRLYAYQVTTPLAQRAGVQSVTATEGATIQLEAPNFDASAKLEFTARKDFPFQDLRDLYKPSLLLSDDHSRSSVSYFFEAQDELIVAIRDLMLGVDLSRWPELSSCCRSIIEQTRTLDWRGAILKWEQMNLGEQSGKAFVEKVITEWNGDAKYQPSNMFNSFVSLYFLIRQNLTAIEIYESIVNEELKFESSGLD
ncbi:potassium channel family protein [Paraburkholderia sp. RL17-383-BIF-A]|uniref:potassium channel family protein n=1 Tax=Paraburkholderia sp. RL17-383-BIF-A TaxID=3031631 RepID=UPI0038BD9270